MSRVICKNHVRHAHQQLILIAVFLWSSVALLKDNSHGREDVIAPVCDVDFEGILIKLKFLKWKLFQLND